MKAPTPNHPGGRGKPNGKGIGDLPAYNEDAMKQASENTDPMKKDNKVNRVVGE